MTDSPIPRKVQEIYVRWDLEPSDYKIGEMLGWLFLGIGYSISILSFFGNLPYIFILLIFPASKLHVDWRNEMPILYDVVKSIKKLEWNSSAQFAFVITILIFLIEVGFMAMLILLI